MNQVILMGRLCKDPETKQTEGGMTVARYSLAIDRRGKKDEADFINCVAFGKSGEFADKYFRKGMRVCISGRIQTGNYTNKEGKKVYTTDVIVNGQEFADGKKTDTKTEIDDGFIDFPEGEELPFL